MAVIDFAVKYEEKAALDMRILESSNIGKEFARILDGEFVAPKEDIVGGDFVIPGPKEEIVGGGDVVMPDPKVEEENKAKADDIFAYANKLRGDKKT